MNRKERRRQKKLKSPAVGVAAPEDALLAEARVHLGAGRLDQAEARVRQCLEQNPQHAEASHLLGLLAYQTGRVEEALEHLGRAVYEDERNPVFLSDLGGVLNLLGRPADAEAACRQALDHRPGYAEAHSNLSVALQVQGRDDEAAKACERAIALDAGNVEARINLGNICRRQGRMDDAIRVYGQALDLSPDNVMALSNLGSAQREKGDLEEAQATCRRAMEISPVYPEAHNTLGTVFAAQGKYGEAAAAFNRAIELRPTYAEAQINLGAAHFSAGRVKDAIGAYEKAIETHPKLAAAHQGLGLAHLAAGNVDKAAAYFRRALEARPDFAEAAYNLASLRPVEPTAEEVTLFRARAEDQTLADGARVGFCFAMGEILDRRREAEEAFAFFRQGNDLRKSVLQSQGLAFDADAHDNRVDRIIAAGIEQPGPGSSSEVPVFIVGMPRSGTTLVEQICASHAQVHGAGEVDRISAMARRLESGQEDPATLADRYLERLIAEAPGAARIIDKTPFNYLHLGHIARLFPRARVIHCRRQAWDVCLSAYFQNFAASHPWSTDLADLGRYYRAYRRLMEHWRRHLPIPMLEVDYETLAGEGEAEVRRIIEYLGLPWDDACLAFDKNPRPVKTASDWQVRQPLHDRSVGRSEAYAAYLGPLEEAL